MCIWRKLEAKGKKLLMRLRLQPLLGGPYKPMHSDHCHRLQCRELVHILDLNGTPEQINKPVKQEGQKSTKSQPKNRSLYFYY